PRLTSSTRSACTPGRSGNNSVAPALSSRSPRLIRAAIRPSAAPSAAAVSAGSLPPAKAPSTSRPVLSCAGLPVFMVNSIGFFLVLMPGSDCRRLWPVRNASVKDAFHRTRAPWRRVSSSFSTIHPMIFRRALQREFAQTAAAVFVALFAILISTVLIRLLGQAAGGRVPADAVAALIGFGALAQLPTVLTLTLFIAILVSLSRSYRDSEMVVWFASGVPLTAWIAPVLMFAVPLVIVVGAGSLWLSPWSQLKSAEYRERLDSRDDTHRVAPGVFRESSGAQRVFFVEVGAGEDG